MAELKQSQFRVRRYTSDDGKHIEELGEWYRFDKSSIAGLLLSQSAEGPPLNDPQDPMDIAGRWAVFRDQKPSFGILKKSNGLTALPSHRYGPMALPSHRYGLMALPSHRYDITWF